MKILQNALKDFIFPDNPAIRQPMKILLSIILLMNQTAFSENPETVDPTKQAELIEQIRQGKKDLTEANLQKANLYKADLTFANLTRADLTEGFLIGGFLIGANLIETNLQMANLAGAKLMGADLTMANLTRAILYKATLTGADFKEANLLYAYIDSKYRDMIMASGALNTDKINWVD